MASAPRSSRVRVRAVLGGVRALLMAQGLDRKAIRWERFW
jgi:hypothetical protein